MMKYSQKRAPVVSAAVALMLGVVVAAPAGAAVVESLDTFAAFPSAAAFQTFNPHDTNTPQTNERTIREDPGLADGTRHITQTFRLGSAIPIDSIHFLFARGVSGNTGVLRIFPVADTNADDFTTEAAGPSLLNVQFTMPAGIDPANDPQTLKLDLTGADQITLPATVGTAGYALDLSSVVDGNTAANNEVFTWRFGDPGSGSGNEQSWYPEGHVLYDDFITASGTEMRRDALFALVAVPEPASLALMGLGGLALLRRRRSTQA